MPTPATGSPASFVPFTGDPTIDALIVGSKWGGALGTGVIVSYSFPDADSVWSTVPSDPLGYDPSDPLNDNPFASQYHGLDAAQQDAARIALEAWSHVANISFVEVPDNATQVGDIRIAFTNGGDIQDVYAYAYVPAPYAYAGDLWINSNQPVPTGDDYSLGANGFNTILHELGHAIGMDHPFSIASFPANLESLKYSTLSYSDFPGHPDTGFSSYYPTTPMLLDIVALQYLYGPNMSWHAGDDTYVFTEGGNYYETIWDAGGNDTIQYLAAGDGALIDLRAGNFSQLGAPIILSDGSVQDDDVAIAFNVVIENATGGDGDDVLIGNGAGNTLDGGLGNDAMSGGAGNDSYYVGEAGDSVTEASAGGTDQVFSMVSFTLGANLEKLTLDGVDAIDATGNALANVLTGNVGDNVLDGRGGNDTLDGGAGADLMTGGAGNDRYVVDSIGDQVVELAGEGIDKLESSISWVLGANLENLALTGTDDIDATGNAAGNALTGNAGDNVLNGGGGNDTMAGAGGNDTYFVVEAGDVVIEAANGGEDTIAAIRSFILPVNVEDLRLLADAGAASGTGNGGDNELVGNGSDNVLAGGAGNDVLLGGRGYDTMTGGAGNDTYAVNRGDGAGVAKLAPFEDRVLEALNAGTDTVLSSMYTYTLDANVENLALVGVGRKGFGNGLDNALTGNGLNNTLDGGAGNDTLSGGTGADRLTGGAGNDSFVFDNLGSGVDRIGDFSTADDAIQLSLGVFGGIGVAGSAIDVNAFEANPGGTATTADHRIVYNETTGALYYDADGDGLGAAVQFAQLSGAPALTAADIAVIA